ncbi:MAG: Tol-Pal system beta propeller repeat protein TolB [Gammaproteobacteria bacterium]|nr:Tol-Pal system beta propeller repeat protein TolB [Gammaproteobacteria bacterium]
MLQSLIAGVLLGGALIANAAPLTIEITQGVEEALPIAIVPFGVTGARKPPEDIAAIISADLSRTGRFGALAEKDMLAKPTEPGNVNFQNWRILAREALVLGNVQYLGADRYKISFWLFDVYKAKQILAFNVSGSQTDFRAAAHKISDIIYQELTGEPGAFSTRIAYVTKKRGAKEPFSLWMADADGHNEQNLLKSKYPIISPKWSPDGLKLAYSSLENAGEQRIYIQEWANGRRNEVSIDLKGLKGAPDWSPDGKKLAFTSVRHGNAEIYVINLANKRLRQVTRHWAIDTEPVWTPDGASIIFTSDRGGQPQLYKISVDGGRVTRLTFEGTENARADVSPDGKRIAMVHRDNGKYTIAVMELATGHLNVLTDGTLDESPSFAPNGSMVIYATTKGNLGQLAAVSVDGSVHQVLAYEDEVREPAWSPINNK